jgi:hypothetical protein
MPEPNQPEKPKDDEQKRHALARNGRDEMNLAEFPFASLRSRGDSRKAIVYESWFADQDGNRQQLRWTAQGGSLVGLPTEFDERVYVALMAITTRQEFVSRKVPFSIYQLLKIMSLPTDSQTRYREVEQSLDRLVGVTFKSEQAFWDNERKEQVTTARAFHLIEEYWLRYKEKDKTIREQEGVAGYIIWSETIWKSFKDNYLKSLDLEFFYGLESPTARRLYRLLDKRLWHKSRYEFDIFDLAGKLGMVRYRFPADVLKILQQAFDELIARGFLESAEVIKHESYTRVRFVKSTKPTSRAAKEEPRPAEKPASEPEENAPAVPEALYLSEGAKEDAELAAADQKDIEMSKERDASDKPYSEDIARLLEQLSQQVLHDPTHIASNITQAQNLWRQSKLSEEEFISLLQEAKKISLKYSGSIRKKAGYVGLKNRAPYFFEVLKNLIREAIIEERKQVLIQGHQISG